MPAAILLGAYHAITITIKALPAAAITARGIAGNAHYGAPKPLPSINPMGYWLWLRAITITVNPLRAQQPPAHKRQN